MFRCFKIYDVYLWYIVIKSMTKKFLTFLPFLFVVFLTACTPGSFGVDTNELFSGTQDQVDQITQDLNKQLEDQVNQQIQDDAFAELFEMSPEDCLSGEQYDPVEKVCYFECENDEECARKEAEILAEIEAIGSDFFEGNVDFQEAEPPGQVPQDIQSNDQQEEETALVDYVVQGDLIVNPRQGVAQTDEERALQQNTAKHQEMWQYFVNAFPADFRVHVSAFSIFTDGKEGTFGAVYQDEQNPNKWVLAMDIVDSYEGGALNQREFPYTMIHEFGHLLTLNETQINYTPPYIELEPGQTQEQALAELERSCAPQFYLQEGCSKEASTINAFYQRFWSDIIEEKKAIESIENENRYIEESEKFYSKYQDRFVTDYAATNVGEDIAESWTAFILQPKPENPQTIAEQKIAFFYEYETLVRLQRHIRSRLNR